MVVKMIIMGAVYVEDADSVPRDICTLRDMFYESDSGKKFKYE